MGSPKSLLRAPDGEIFLDRLIGILGSFCSPVIVVLGCGATEIRNSLARAAEAQIVLNEAWPSGQLSSFQCGLRAVPPESTGVIFTPVDYPAIQPATVARLAAEFERHPLLVIPRHAGRNGHPVCCPRSLIPEFLALGEHDQARDVIHRHRADTLYVEVDDPGILKDIDDQDAYNELIRTTR